MQTKSFVGKVLALVVMFGLVGSSALVLLPAVAAATPPSSFTVGVLYPPVSTFFQSATEEYIGNTATDIPYLAVDRLSITGNVVPGICTVPQPVSGTNDTQWIVNLISPNMKWSDGVSINATDLAYSFGIDMTTGQYANTSTVDRWGAVRGTFTSISIMNSTAIKITTSTSDPKFPLLTFLYVVYPYHYYKQFGFGNNVLGTTSILSGPGDSAYVPANYTAGSFTMNLNANPLSPSWNGATPAFKTMTIQFFTQDSAQVSSLAAGTLDSALISPSDVSALQSSSSIGVTQVPSDYQLMTYVHSTGYPWNNTAFRQALMYLVNRSQIDQTLYGGQTATGNPEVLIPQAVPTYLSGSGTPMYNYSVSTATSLLKQAGMTQNSQGKWMLPNGTALTVNVEAPNNDPNYVRASQLVQGTFESAGINVNLLNPAYAQADTDWTSNHFQFLIFPNNYAPSPFRWMRNPFNIPGWTNATFTATFKQALSDPNSTSSLSEIKQAELIMAQAAVLNSIVILPQYVAYNKAQYTNWQPALSNAPSSSVFWDPVTAENVVTAISYPGATGSSTSSTLTTSSTTNSTTGTSSSGVISTTSSSTTSTASNSGTLYLVAGIVVVIIVIAALATFFMRRRPKSAPPAATR
ncbi:MAG: ABC transporter substrate-binding protein [Nitrososphaerales archaeon]